MEKKANQEILDLKAQAKAARRAAETADESNKELAFAAAATVESVARSRQRSAEVPVQVLVADATPSEVRVARQRRAVRRGRDVFLPSWRDAAVGLPNTLLRSALFSASSSSRAALFEEPIAAQGDVVITLTGHQLCDYDRRVFAVCLNHYRDDRPLAPEDSTCWVEVSFWQFAQDLGSTYCIGVHKAIRASLIRLNAAHLRIRVNRKSIPMPRLLDVSFDEGMGGTDTSKCNLLGSDLVVFRVLESMANLFGPTDWTAVSKQAILDYAGLAAWLACFYSTHAEPYELEIKGLYDNSGVICEMREFRRMLKTALTKLMASDTPTEFRVSSFEIDKVTVTVSLVRWSA